jgi:protein-tyrosine-phosphatase
MIDYLFICQWNIARSQIAEWFAKTFFPHKKVASCGIDDVWHKYNFQCYPQAIKIMAKKWIDISKQKPKVITKELVNSAKKIFVFCKEEECYNWFPDYLKSKKNVEFIYFNDPNKKKEKDIELIVSQIEEFVEKL